MSILDEASKVRHQRGDNYGHPLINHQRIAKIWSVILEREVTPSQVALCMIGLKLARLVQTPGHHDSIVDIAGYVDCLGEIEAAKEANRNGIAGR